MRIFILTCLIGMGLPGIKAQTKKPTVAVLEFSSTGELSTKEVSTIANRFRGHLVNTNTFRVVEREKMTSILKEQDFVLSENCNTNECAVQVGQLLGVEYIVAGDIGKLGLTYTIDLRLVEVSTGEIAKTESRDYKGEVDGLLQILSGIATTFAGTKSASVTTSVPAETKKGNINQNVAASSSPKSFKKFCLYVDLGSRSPNDHFKKEFDAKDGFGLGIGVNFRITKKLDVGGRLGASTLNDNQLAEVFLTSRYRFREGNLTPYGTIELGSIAHEYEPGFEINAKVLGFGIGFGLIYEPISWIQLNFSLILRTAKTDGASYKGDFPGKGNGDIGIFSPGFGIGLCL